MAGAFEHRDRRPRGRRLTPEPGVSRQPRRSTRTIIAASLVGAAIGLVAGLLARVPAAPVATTTFAVRGTPDGPALDRAASILQTRLRAFDDRGATVTAQAGHLTALERWPPGTTAAPDGWSVLADPLRFELRPVVSTIAAGDPGWSTTPVSACPYSAARDGCSEGIRSVCPYGDDAGECAPEAMEDDAAVFLGTDSAIYHLGPAILTADDVRTASEFVNGPAASVISVELTDRGTARLRDVTTGHLGEQLAIVLDQQVVSAPSIAAPIDSGRLQIFQLPVSDAELRAQAIGLRAPPLPVLLGAGSTRVEDHRTVSVTRVMALAAVGAVLGAAVGFLVGRRRRERPRPDES
jgi:hypothetical protein